MNKKQKDLILQCAIDICIECDYKDTCQNALECNTELYPLFYTVKTCKSSYKVLV
ncbi:hypothetical protein EQ882_11425 [Clostridioides difficile]|nr:hypothetical protein [Clostridioides difficile]